MENVVLIRLCLLLQTVLHRAIFASTGGNRTRHHNCLTWSDDQHALYLTCRVSNFVLPVTFNHDESNISVTCHIRGEKHFCTPSRENFINHLNSTVTIIIAQQKAGRHLDGKWYCKQGDITQSTKVSLSKGIIIDSWVQLRGKSFYKNGTEFINVECSSCRKPKGLYVEFFVNDVTKASVWRNDHGDCRHDHTSCFLLGTCGCSEAGNVFSFHLQIQNINVSTNLSCYMQFYDGLRRGIFSTTTSIGYTGEDFLVSNNKTVVIKNNSVPYDSLIYSTPTSQSETVAIETTPTTSIIWTSSSKDPDNKEGLKPEYIAIIVVSILIVTGCILFIIYKLRRSKQDKKDTGQVLSNDSRENQELLLCNSEVCNLCETSLKSTSTDLFCFDCQKKYCHGCNIKLHGKICEVKWHKVVNVKFIPKTFCISTNNCISHMESRLELFCNKHKVILCRQCSISTHINCSTTPLLDIPKDEVKRRIEKLSLDLQIFDENLGKFESRLSGAFNSFEKQMKTVKETVSSLKLAKCVINSADNTAHFHTMSSFWIKLDNIETSYSKENTGFIGIMGKRRSYIKDQLNNLQFILKYAGNNHLLIEEYQLQNKLTELRKEADVNKCLFYTLEITFSSENEEVYVKTNALEDLGKNPWS